MKKINRSHSTYIERASGILKFLNKNSNISKISLGLIKVKRPPSKTHGPFKISLSKSQVLFEANSKNANQKIHIYGENLEKVSEDIQKYLKKEGEEFNLSKT